jgi:hypothetical protein
MQFDVKRRLEMPNDTREPQSYGSQSDWQSGKTGQQVHDPKSAGTRVDEPEDADRGGRVSDVQLADNVQPVTGATSATGADVPVQKVTSRDTGAKRESYFRKRDYE